MQSLWIAKTGLDAQQTRMSVISNNLANVNTNGFKRGRAVFEDLLYQNVQQAGAATSQDTAEPHRPEHGHRCAGRRHREELPAGRQRRHRQPAGRARRGPRFLPGAAARRASWPTPATARSRSTQQGRIVTAAGLPDAAGHHHPERRGQHQHLRRRHHRGETPGPAKPDADRHDADRRLHQPGRPAARGQNLYIETAASGTAADRHAGARTASASSCRGRWRART